MAVTEKHTVSVELFAPVHFLNAAKQEQMKAAHKQRLFAVSLADVLFLTGCKSIGPSQISGDRFDYSEAISESASERPFRKTTNKSNEQIQKTRTT